MINIPPFNVTRQYKLIGEEIAAQALEVLQSGYYIGGSQVTDFENQFAEYIGTSTAVACNSGTDALYLALRALDIKTGDEVITTPFTFIATSETIVSVGATPVFIDIDPQTYNLDLNQLEAAITPQTKAIIPVHLFGQPVDMGKLMAIACKHNLLVIEDCAQATGAQWDGDKVGKIGHVGCFSFYPTKNLGGCGDGGMLTTNDDAIAAKVKMLRDHGRNGQYFYEENGVNSRLDAIQATILKVKLAYLDTWNQQRAEIAANYEKLLGNVAGIKLPQALTAGKSVWNQYTIRVLDKQVNSGSSTRDHVRSSLQEQGLRLPVYYPLPLHLQPVYQHLGSQPGSLPISEQCSREVLSLPMFPELVFEEQQTVVNCLQDCFSKLPV